MPASSIINQKAREPLIRARHRDDRAEMPVGVGLRLRAATARTGRRRARARLEEPHARVRRGIPARWFRRRRLENVTLHEDGRGQANEEGAIRVGGVTSTGSNHPRERGPAGGSYSTWYLPGSSRSVNDPIASVVALARAVRPGNSPSGPAPARSRDNGVGGRPPLADKRVPVITARRGSVTSRSNVSGAVPGHGPGRHRNIGSPESSPAGGTTLSCRDADARVARHQRQVGRAAEVRGAVPDEPGRHVGRRRPRASCRARTLAPDTGVASPFPPWIVTWKGVAFRTAGTKCIAPRSVVWLRERSARGR